MIYFGLEQDVSFNYKWISLYQYGKYIENPVLTTIAMSLLFMLSSIAQHLILGVCWIS